MPPPRPRISPFTIGATVLLLHGSGCHACIHEMTTQRVHAYRPSDAVERADADERMITGPGKRTVVLETRWVPVPVTRLTPTV